MRIFQPSDKITFGKNKGYKLELIWKFEPTYLSWLILNHESFCIEIDNFYLLPKPTPLQLGYVNGSKEKTMLMSSKRSLLNKYLKSDINQNICLDDLIEMENKDGALKKVDFKFSEEVTNYNAIKVSRINKYLK